MTETTKTTWKTALGAGLPLAMLAGIVCGLTVNAPYLEDTRCILGYLSEPFPARLAHLADFNNEHRLVTTRLAAEAARALFGRIDFRVLCGVGAAALAGWMLLVGRALPRRRGDGMLLSACAFLAFSFVNFENTCWAVGGLSNYQSLFWGLCANLLAAHGRAPFRFTAALVCAILATLSNGGGLAIWPCLLLQTLFGRTDGEPASSCGRSVRTATVAAVAAAVIALYFVGFPPKAEYAAPDAPLTAAANRALFLLGALGGAVPFYGPALALGAAVAAMLAFVFRHGRDLRGNPLFFHLLYLLGIMGAAAVGRGADPQMCVCTRYTIFSQAILICTLLLFSRLRPLPPPVLRAGWCLALLYAAGTLAVGAPQYTHRNEIMRRNVLLWPERTDGIRCWPEERALYDGIFRTCRARGLYDPAVNLKPGEERPTALTPWLR